jgi:hypothetical protein
MAAATDEHIVTVAGVEVVPVVVAAQPVVAGAEPRVQRIADVELVARIAKLQTGGVVGRPLASAVCSSSAAHPGPATSVAPVATLAIDNAIWRF